MNIFDAVKTRKLYKRKNDKIWFRNIKVVEAEAFNGVIFIDEAGAEVGATLDDLMANDWQAKED